MKIICTVHGKPALVVGYAPGRKGRPMAVVITQGELRSVRLKDIILSDIPSPFQSRGKDKPKANAA